MATIEQASGKVGSHARSTAAVSVPLAQSPALVLPLALGACFALAATLLVFVELAQPPQQPGFKGIRFSNAINSKGARQIVALYRDSLSWLPRPFTEPLSPNWYVAGLVIAWASMVGLQIAAVVACRRTHATNPMVWAIGPVITSLVLLAYPPTSTDVYAYASFGWVADEGQNPYFRSPESLHGDPYARFNDWTHIESPYGPIWTAISRGVVHFSRHDPFATALGFKIIATLAGFGLAITTYWLARRLTNDPHLAVLAFVLVAWSPILITEAAATVHLDPLMMLLAMLGFAAATGTRTRSVRLGLVLTAASALVKPVTLPLVALLLLTRLAEPERMAVIARRIALDLLVIAAVVTAGFAAYWDRSLPVAMFENLRALYLDHPLRSNPLWVWAFNHVDSVLNITGIIGEDTAKAMRWTVFPLAAGVGVVWVAALLRQRARLVAGEAASPRVVSCYLLRAWAAVTVIIGILPINAHAWYVIWSMAPLALLWVSDGLHIRRRPPLWLLAIQGWTLLSFLVYHTLPKG